jgi:hypothetical protein
MPPIPFADNFLAGSLISLLFPVCLLIAIAVWYVLGFKRFGDAPPTGEPRSQPAAPPDGEPPRSAR